MPTGGSSGIPGIDNAPSLPVFNETALPSATGPQTLVAAVDGSGNLKLAISDGTKWFIFTHDTTAS